MTSRVVTCPACSGFVRAFEGIDVLFERSPMRARRVLQLDGIDLKRILVWVDHADLCIGTGTGTHGAVAEQADGSTPSQPEEDHDEDDGVES